MVGLPKFLFGGVGGPLRPFSNPHHWKGAPTAIFFPCFSCMFQDKTTGTVTVCHCHCHSHCITPKGGGGLLLVVVGRSNTSLPPPPPRKQVGAKMSDICFEEISLWPLEPLFTPPLNLGGLQGPCPPPNKMFTSLEREDKGQESKRCREEENREALQMHKREGVGATEWETGGTGAEW